MKAPNQSILDDLQTTCQLFASLAGQFQVDVRQLHAMGLGWLQERVMCWYQKSEKQLRIFIDRLLYFETDPAYDPGAVQPFSDVASMLTRQGKAIYAAKDELIGFRKAAWNVEADYTPDEYEHAIECLEKIAIKIDRELMLLKRLGEPGYIGARLEDE